MGNKVSPNTPKHLSENEEVDKPVPRERESSIKSEGKPFTDNSPTVSFLQLYKYATSLDKFFIFVASICSVIAAICFTAFNLTFGYATNIITFYVGTVTNNTNQTEISIAKENLDDGMCKFVMVTCLIGIGILISTYCSTTLFNYSALRQTYRIRELFFAKILDQDIPWYDVHQTGDFASRVADDLKKLEEGIGEKVSTFLFYEATFVANTLQGLIKGWHLALICMITFPITTVMMSFVSWISARLSKQEMDAYGEAGAIAEEALSSIRTVVAFGGQEKEQEKYDSLLLSARNYNIKRSLFNGISNGLMWFFPYANFAIAFYYGVKLFLQEKDLPPEEVVYDAGNLITIFSSILTGAWYFGMASPFIETFSIARGAATKIFAIIASEPIINSFKGKGVKPRKIEGNIVFKDVHFSYPSRPDTKVLQGLDLSINSGETVALVGASGCGKSTCIQLIQRFYDPTSGDIHVDNENLTELDLSWLRNHIGVVSQEPVLFETTIAENIKYGCITATQENIEKAAKKANAHNFVSALPNGYNTLVGERGAQLSGGQKQRIAIARALLREPAILLLDEATSALDTKSEAVVQSALDTASSGCTTVIVAHRLSTVRKAKRIVVMSEGRVQEQGSHDELMAAKGAYYQLVIAQVSPEEDDEEEPFFTLASAERSNFLRQRSVDVNSFISARPDTITKEVAGSSSLWAIMKLSSPEWWVIIFGSVCAVMTGLAIPLNSIVFGKVIGVLAADDPDYLMNEVRKYSLVFLVLGIITGVTTVFQTYMFGIASEKLIMRLRSLMFKAFLNQEMGWFDDSDNGVGALCARLSGEAASVQGATGQRIGAILNAVATILFTLSASFWFEWRIAFVSLTFCPLIILSIFLEQKIVAKESQGSYKALQNSTKIAVGAISNIRIVASLGCEKIFHDLYMAQIIPYQDAAKRNTHYRGVVYGFSRSLMCFAYAAAFYYGVKLVKNEGLDYALVFIVSECLITSSWSLASALAFTPNLQKGLIAADRIFKLLSRVPKVQNGSDDVREKWNKGDIKYEKVYFSYPTRPTAQVLKGFDLSIFQGKMVALVGPSGCGKSTIIQLLERFYDPTYGQVTADGKPIADMHLAALRSHLGIVSQEPNLFSRTIAENIAYGDNGRVVTKEEVIDASKKANIHSFITSLPLGYDTKLGEKGTQLSGGQKQRVAIARALVRNPKVLLLDEATSALDAESERVVQEALDSAKVGRTCISIAHRLTTIQDADVICVINHGKVAEMGTHAELLSLKGLYYNLHSLQNGLN